MGAKIILMHVLTGPVYYFSVEYSPNMGFNDYLNMGTFQTDTVQGLKKAAQHFLDRTKSQLSDENIQTLLKEDEYKRT